MGLLQRLGDIVGGAKKAAANSFDVTWDVASAVWGDDDESTFKKFGRLLTLDLQDAWEDRDVQNALHRSRPGGTLWGAAGRFAARSVSEPVSAGLDLMNTAYREGISEPISGLMTFGSLLDDPNFHGSLIDAAKEADRIAEHRSPGQAIALAFSTESVTDDNELEESMSADWWNITTGLTDAALQILADPTDIASKGARIVTASRRLRMLEETAELGVKSKAGASVAKVVKEAIDNVGVERAPSVVRSRLFPSRTTQAGDVVSSLLVYGAQQRDGVQDLLIRTFAGSSEAYDTLVERAPHFADAAAMAMRDARDYISVNGSQTVKDALGNERFGRLVTLPGDGTHGKAAYELSTAAALRANEELTRIEKAANLVGVWGSVPKATTRGAIREGYTRSNLYQSSPWARPLRIVNWTKPRRAINVHEANIDVQVLRALQEVGAPLDVQDTLRSKAINAALTNSTDRRSIINETHDYIVDKVAADIGLVDEKFVRRVDEIVAEGYPRVDAEQLARAEGLSNAKYDEFKATIRQLREDARQMTRSTYRANDNIESLFLKDAADDVVHEVRAPALSTQMSNYEWLPDTRRLSFLAQKIAKNNKRFAGPAEVTDDVLDLFYAVWKPVTLFGVRTPIRVGTDELMRRIADFGAVAVGKDIGQQLLSKTGAVKAAGEEAVQGATREFAPAFANDIYRDELIRTAKPGVMYGRARAFGDDAIYDDMVGVRDWRTIDAKDKAYSASWEHAANKQIAQTPLARRLLQNGMDREAAIKWLESGDGYRILRTADEARKLDPEGWVDEVASQIDWLLPTPELQQAALRGEAKAADFIAHFDDIENVPGVHAQFIRDLTTGKSAVVGTLNRFTDRAMTLFNTYPTVFLQRSPHFARKYTAEVLRLEQLALKNNIDLTDNLAREFEDRARKYALEQVRDLLFDMNETSQLADTLRIAAPFANATREVTTRWAGIIWRKPEVVRRLQQVWQSPAKAGLEIDGNGNEVQGDGWSITPDGERVRTEGEISLRFSIPSGLPLPDSLKPAGGSIRFSKDSFNTIIANPWGVGPVVTAAASVLLKDKPDMQESLKFMFPYGVPESVVDAFTPNPIRTLTQNSDDRSYMAMKGYYFNSLYAEWAADGMQLADGQTAKQKANELWREAEATVRTMWKIRAFTSMVAPVQPKFTSPYQAYVDIYRRYAKQDPSTAAMRFAEDYGTELLSLTTSVTKTVNGVPPTLEGWRGYNKHKQLIDENPELGRIILGEVGGEFSRAVYQHQLRTGQREYRTKDDIMSSPEKEAGWIMFQRGMDAIDAERIDRGLDSLRGKRARDLAEAKRELVDGIAAQFPSWGEQYFQIDLRGKDRFVDSLRAITQEKSLQSREDIRGLIQYIALRDSIKAELRQRQTGSLESKRNADLLAEWESGRGFLVQRYLTFAPLFYRYFDTDMPEA